MKPAIENLEDLAKSKDVGLIVRSDTIFGQEILVGLNLTTVLY